MRERDYEDLLDCIMGMLLVLYEAQIAPNDMFMEALMKVCDEHGYEIPGGLE